MRWLRVAAAVCVILAGGGCAKAIDGAAVAPLGTNPTETVLLTDDGFGIELGRPTARVALEIFIEPQCSLCARLEMFQRGRSPTTSRAAIWRSQHRADRLLTSKRTRPSTPPTTTG